MQFLDFEKPIEEIYGQITKLKEMSAKNHVDVSGSVTGIGRVTGKNTFTAYIAILLPWQRVQLSRHPERPYTSVLY